MADAKYCLTPLNVLAQTPNNINKLKDNHDVEDTLLIIVKNVIKVTTDKKDTYK